jgi:hypothetical protein
MYQHIKACSQLQQCTEGSRCCWYEITMQLLLGYCTLYSEQPGRELCILMFCSSGGPAARYHSQLQSCSLWELVQQVSMSSGTSTPCCGPLVDIDARPQRLRFLWKCGYCYTRAVQSKGAIQYRELLCLFSNPVVSRRQSPSARESR